MSIPWIINASSSKGTAKIATQQCWNEGNQMSIVDITHNFDLIIIDGNSPTQMISDIKSLNPKAIILPFDSTHWHMPNYSEGDKTLDINDLVSAAIHYKSKGFDGIYVDLWNILEENVANEAARRLREAWPDGILIANGAEALKHSYDLNGYMMEDYPVYSMNFEDGVRIPYENWITKAHAPHFIIMNQRSLDDESTKPDFWKRMRYAVCISLLFDEMYVKYNFGSGGSPHWASPWLFDEYKVDLGQPLGKAYKLPNGVYVRKFTNGAVLVNPTYQPQTVRASDLGETYYRFLGSQRPDFNDGKIFTDVTLDGYSMNGLTDTWGKPVGDGIILVKSPQTIVSDILIDDEVEGETGKVTFTHNNIQGEFTHNGFTYTDGGGYINPFDYSAWSVYPSDSAHYALKGDGTKWARWTPRIGISGQYEIFIWYPNRFDKRFINFDINSLATNARIKIHHADGDSYVTVNMRQNGGRWVSLGTYRLMEGTSNYVELRNDADGIVLADAIKFVYKEGGTLSTTTTIRTSTSSTTYQTTTYTTTFTSITSTTSTTLMTSTTSIISTSTTFLGDNMKLLITADNQYRLYFNGIYIGSDTRWEDAETYILILRPGKNVIAIEAINTGMAAGLLVYGEYSGGRIYSNSSWKYSLTEQSGWQSLEFDDLAWSNAIENASYGSGVWANYHWGIVDNFPNITKAKWIWSKDNMKDTKVYFRYTFYVAKTFLGDVNLDGQRNIVDVVMIVRHLIGAQLLAGQSLANADANQDGFVNILDVTVLIRHIIGEGQLP
jgi:hypothetical protein